MFHDMYIQVFTHPLCTDTQIASKYLLLQIRENSSSLLSQYMHISMRFSKMYIWNKIWKILPNASSKKMLLFPHISPHICHIYALFLQFESVQFHLTIWTSYTRENANEAIYECFSSIFGLWTVRHSQNPKV